MKRPAAAELDARSPATSAKSPLPPPHAPAAGWEAERRRSGPHSVEEVEARYVEARDAWVVAMHAANSGRPADLASLAIAQEAYEAAVAERERWLSGRVSIPIEPAEAGRNLEIAVGQELAWREIHDQPTPAGLIGRLRRRFRRR